ncbi:EAL domain-containing protein [Azoarcus sp. L1K30]|uniref:bifunctional diguanylate cyclase/phosphodiesterase n=1 Tax=Azoarcus sp. L1K30 TaxID=2820277 RepID=UPI001B846564|nr:LapD/MoxY N-terminal periplasmic domain-containing protein [Azoarcus sp. L1K30]MBR0567709.1 EAL domain-containing protein [Azoarcus sp. L1K30]
MSLIKQLWIAIVMVTLLSLGGSLVVSTLAAKRYLEEQLNVKNVDNATALALSLSQMPKDPVTVELQVAAQFDAGHYRLIRLVGPDGKTMVERAAESRVDDVPTWFVRLASIEAHPGVAHVQDGWQQFATLTLESQTSYAYTELWRSLRQLLIWFCVMAAMAGLAGSLLLGRITAPLRKLVGQAEAIGERRFVTTPEPTTAELRVVVRSMNALSDRVRLMLVDEARRLEVLRKQTQEDPVTGLFERRQFLNVLEAQLADHDDGDGGALLIARIGNLAELNRTLGRESADALLVDLANALRAQFADQPAWIAGRLNGTDLSVLAPGVSYLPLWAERFAKALHDVVDRAAPGGTDAAVALPIAAALYGAGESLQTVLTRTDTALAEAELAGSRAVQLDAWVRLAQPQHDQSQWRQVISRALEQGELRLETYPVRDVGGSLLHVEAPLRLRLDGAWRGVAYFMPWAVRLGLMGQIDAAVVRAAIELIRSTGQSVAVNISAQAIRDAGFIADLLHQLETAPNEAAKLWMEVPEQGAARHQTDFRTFCLALKPMACKLGLEHAGPHFNDLGDLHDLGLDYIKVDASLLRDLAGNPGNQAFARSLCMLAHALGLTVIAEGVDNNDAISTLNDVGFDAMTGPGIH